MRLDHLLSKEEKVGVVLLLCYQGITGNAEERAVNSFRFRKLEASGTFREAREAWVYVMHMRRPAEQNMRSMF